MKCCSHQTRTRVAQDKVFGKTKFKALYVGGEVQASHEKDGWHRGEDRTNGEITRNCRLMN
jgi:hypothetical protein